jgi:hypothetical protein
MDEATVAIKAARFDAPKAMDAREAVRRLVGRLGKSEGYFIWTPFKDKSERETTWLMRIPRHDLPEATWLKNEKANIVHLCRPLPLLEAVEAGEKDRTVAHSGYVVEEVCVRCSRACPEKVGKRLKGLVNMYSLSQKVV